MSAIVPAVGVMAQEPLSKKDKKTVVENITRPWQDWETLTVSGKLKMAGLPLSPSLKMYMEKDSLVRISLRAPLMGEVGRAEIDADSILVVNKMKKTYVKEPLDSLLSRYPITLGDVQSLFLGRVVLPGFGTLTSDDYKAVELFPEERGEYSLIPSEALELEEFNYGYLIDSESRPEVLLVIPAENPDINVNVTYDYDENGKGYDLFVSYQSPDKIYSGTLQFDEFVEGGNPIEPIKLNNKYSKMNFSDFIKSF